MTYRIHQAHGGIVERQQRANKMGAQCFVDQHLNAASDPNINYGFVIVANNASAKTEAWAHTYLELLESELGLRTTGVMRGVRGSGNVRHCRCPSMLLEPGFVSNPEFADMIRTGEGIDGLALVLVKSIREHFPDPAAGPIALSAGHAHRDGDDDASTGDPGALVYDYGDAHVDPDFDTEAELNDAIVKACAEILANGFDG